MREKRGREERIDCLCGVTADTPAAEQYTGLWLQCDECLSWLHGACVGYPKRPPKGANPLPPPLPHCHLPLLSCTHVFSTHSGVTTRLESLYSCRTADIAWLSAKMLNATKQWFSFAVFMR